MNYYKVKIKKVKRTSIYFILLLLIIFNAVFYSIIAYKDYKYSEKINYSYKNILRPSTKKLLTKKLKNITIKEFITNIIQNEYNIYFTHTLFIELLMKKNIKPEIKNNLIIYSIDILQKIKLSSLFLDLKVLIFTNWNYPKNEIIKLIKLSLKIDNNLVNHRILFKKEMINKYSKDIIKFYKPKTLVEKNSYFNYLIRTKYYKKIIDYIENHKINIDIKTLDKSMASNIIKIGDLKKSENIILNLIKKEKIDYLYYYLSILYKNNNKINKEIEALEKIRYLNNYNKYYMIYLAQEYYKQKKYIKAINLIFNTNNKLIKRYCYRYIKYVNKLPFLDRGKYLERVKYICNKKQIYSTLSRYYKKAGNREKYDLYNLEINILK